MVAVVFGSPVSEAQVRACGESLLADARVVETVFHIAPSGQIALVWRNDNGRLVEERFDRGEDARAFSLLRSERAIFVPGGQVLPPGALENGRDPASVVAAHASMPSGAGGTTVGVLRALGRFFFGVDAALLAAPWCAMPRSVLSAACDATPASAVVPAVIARVAPRAGVPVTGVRTPAGAPSASAWTLALALWRGVGFALTPAGARPFARALLVCALALAFGGLFQKTAETSRRAFLTFASDSVRILRWGVPAVELRRHLPAGGKVFAVVEPRPVHFRTYWYLQNCLCPCIVVCDVQRFKADARIAHVVMKFGDPAREAEFCATYDVQVVARCADGFAVGRRGP